MIRTWEFCCPLFSILVDNLFSCRTSYPIHRIEIINHSVEPNPPRQTNKVITITMSSIYYLCRLLVRRRDTVLGVCTMFPSTNCQWHCVCASFLSGRPMDKGREQVKLVPVDDYLSWKIVMSGGSFSHVDWAMNIFRRSCKPMALFRSLFIPILPVKRL